MTEADLENKRNVLRRALKKEFIRTAYPPRNFGEEQGVRVFDTAMARWHALHNSYEFIGQRNWKNGLVFAATWVIPFSFLLYQVRKEGVSGNWQ